MKVKVLRRVGVIVVVGLGIFAALALYLVGGDLLQIQPMRGTAEPSASEEQETDLEDIEQRLLAVGIHPTGRLSDLGVDDHMARLANGEVTAGQLLSYAQAIETISKHTLKRGQPLPPTLWDVSTPALREAGWTVYGLTMALASDAGLVHVNLLSDAYAAFFRSRPNALRGALDLLPLARAYVTALPEAARAERSVYARSDGEATILIWQALLSGTTRQNPLTHRPLWSHGFVGHFSVPHIHQYATGRGATPSAIWGVEGFDPSFVGPASNNNQVEHMGISALLQGIVHIPGAVLNAVEAIEVFVDHEDPAAARADRALNRIVREVLVPRIEDDALEIVDALNAALE